jgi:hypothetical protein
MVAQSNREELLNLKHVYPYSMTRDLVWSKIFIKTLHMFHRFLEVLPSRSRLRELDNINRENYIARSYWKTTNEIERETTSQTRKKCVQHHDNQHQW